MATYYIDPTASAGGSGSIGSPFDSWTDVTWTDGNTYLMKRGTSEQITSQIEPTTSNIILGAYGTGPRPIIELHNVSSTETAVIFMDDIIGWTIKDLEIKSTDTTVYPTTSAGGIRVSATTQTDVNSIIENVHISKITDGTDDYKGIVGGNVDYLTINNCIVENVGSDCIYLNNTNYSTISNCVLQNFDLNTNAGDGIHFNNDCNYNLVKGNTILFTSAGPKGCIVNPGSNTYGGSIFENNYLSGGSFSLNMANIDDGIFRNNICVNFDGYSVILGIRTKIYNNLFIIDDASIVDTEAINYTAVMDVAGNVVEIYNNVFYSAISGTYDTVLDGNSAYNFVNNPVVKFFNNIISAQGMSRYYKVLGVATLYSDNNLLYNLEDVVPICNVPTGAGDTTPNTFAALQSEGYDLNSIYDVNPLLDSNYKPTAESPCINAGVKPLSNIDHKGKYRKGPGYDIGAVWHDSHEDSTTPENPLSIEADNSKATTITTIPMPEAIAGRECVYRRDNVKYAFRLVPYGDNYFDDSEAGQYKSLDTDKGFIRARCYEFRKWHVEASLGLVSDEVPYVISPQGGTLLGIDGMFSQERTKSVYYTAMRGNSKRY